ncbi:MAG TPA: hypothetical protein VE988_17685 [Gemmataceae bacterium]|nr:hypothetical protein [Gemmataceae bacterium]
MARRVILAVLGALCIFLGIAQGSSRDKGHYREQHMEKLEARTLEANGTYEFDDIFRDNQRACVIVEGDHKVKGASLTLRVLDAAGNLVAIDSGGGDCVAVFWYPPKVQRYRIVIKNNNAADNDLDIVVK